MRQTQARLLPPQLARRSPIHCHFAPHRLGRFHHRLHAPIHLRNQGRHSRSIRPSAALTLPRPHGFTVLFRNHPDRADGKINPIVFFQFPCRPSERTIRPKIRDRPLQGGRAAAAFHFRRLRKRPNLPAAPPLPEDLFSYFDFSQPRVPVEFFLRWRFTPGWALYSSSFFCC